jgi:hypothetical protein
LKSAEGIAIRPIQTRGEKEVKDVRGLRKKMELDGVPDAVLGQRVRQLNLPDLHLVHVEIYTRKILKGKCHESKVF